MKLATLGMTIALALGAITDAGAATFNVTGSNLGGDTIVGTIEADAGLTTITSVSLLVAGPGFVADGLRDVFVSYAAPLLVAESPFPSTVVYVYLSFAGVPDLGAMIANHIATYDPAVCGVNESCISFVTAQRNVPFFATATTTETPLPAALPLFATALGVFGLFGYRRKRV